MSSQARDIIDRLLVALNAKTQAQLAASLEIRPQSIVSAIGRGEIPEAWLYRVAYLTGRSVEWLRTGKGPVWHGNATVAESMPSYSERPPSAPLRRILDAWDSLDHDEQAAVGRCADALRLGDREIRDHLVHQLKLIEELIQMRRARRAGRR